jgi:hypothetical protein
LGLGVATLYNEFPEISIDTHCLYRARAQAGTAAGAEFAVYYGDGNATGLQEKRNSLPGTLFFAGAAHNPAPGKTFVGKMGSD